MLDVHVASASDQSDDQKQDDEDHEALSCDDAGTDENMVGGFRIPVGGYAWRTEMFLWIRTTNKSSRRTKDIPYPLISGNPDKSRAFPHMFWRQNARSRRRIAHKLVVASSGGESRRREKPELDPRTPQLPRMS